MTDVRITLTLTRGREILFTRGEAAEGEHDAPLTLPSTVMVAGESLAGAAERLAATVGFSSVEALGVQHVVLAATTASDEPELRIAIAARAPAGTEPVMGSFRLIPEGDEPLSELAATVIDACRRNATLVDLDGAVLPVRPFPPAPGSLEALFTPPPTAAFEDAIAPTITPTTMNAGVWFGGALLWISSVLLVLDSFGILRDGGGPLLWVIAAGSALLACTHAGVKLEDARAVALRALPIFGIGAAILLVSALFVGVLMSHHEEAYAFLGVIGVPTFLLAQRSARKRMPPVPVTVRRALIASEAFAVFATLVVYAMMIH